MKYNRKSIRLNNFDYSNNGYYFVTICAQNRKNIFGEIKNGKMILNKNGLILEKWINKISEHFNNVIIDIYQIMPDHIHLILKINLGRVDNLIKPGRENRAPTMITLGKIVAYFKYQSTKEINDCRGGVIPPILKNNFNKLFQRNYYERIIRNEKEYLIYKKYIKDNPINFWCSIINYERRK